MSDRGINKLIKIVAVLILLPLGVVIPTLSLESYYAPPTSAQTTDKELEERLKTYKSALKEELRTTEQQRIKLRCLAVQTNIKTLNVRVESVQTKRATAYDNITSKLNDLITRLDAQAFDVTTLQESTTTLTEKVDAYKSTMTEYAQAVEDLTVIDCAQDPTSFKAALETARTKHRQLVTMVGDIRTFIANTTKPQLQTIKAALGKSQTTEPALTTDPDTPTTNIEPTTGSEE